MKRGVEKTQCEVVCLESWGKGLKYHISAWLCACTIQVGVWVAHARMEDFKKEFGPNPHRCWYPCGVNKSSPAKWRRRGVGPRFGLRGNRERRRFNLAPALVTFGSGTV